MSDLLWLTDGQMERLRPFFPRSHGNPGSMIGGPATAVQSLETLGARWGSSCA